MIFVAETDERSLYTFVSEEEAIAYCEGVDVEAGVWLFWDDAGRPLQPSFSIPNKRGAISCASGVYSLEPATSSTLETLDDALSTIFHFGTAGPLNTASKVRDYISQRK
jgi:hypothetical protein